MMNLISDSYSTSTNDQDTNDDFVGPLPLTHRKLIGEESAGGPLKSPYEQQLPPDRLRAASARLKKLAEILNDPGAASFGLKMVASLFGVGDEDSPAEGPLGREGTDA